jgi:hypothetical protein
MKPSDVNKVDPKYTSYRQFSLFPVEDRYDVVNDVFFGPSMDAAEI